MAGHIPTAVSCDWCTEDRICDLNAEVFGKRPDLDPCSNPYSHVRARFEFTLQKGNDGLIDDWMQVNGVPIKDGFVNPPYGKGWWRIKPCASDCHGLYYAPGATKPMCLCGAAGRREYIWPSDRDAQKAKLAAVHGWENEKKKILTKPGKKAFDAWAKQWTMVDIGDWIHRTADYGRSIDFIGLVPSYPGTQAWKNDVWPRAKAIFFPEGRLHFRLVYTLPDGDIVEKTGPAPMDTAMPLWTPDRDLVDRFRRVFSQHGHVVVL